MGVGVGVGVGSSVGVVMFGKSVNVFGGDMLASGPCVDDVVDSDVVCVVWEPESGGCCGGGGGGGEGGLVCLGVSDLDDRSRHGHEGEERLGCFPVCVVGVVCVGAIIRVARVEGRWGGGGGGYLVHERLCPCFYVVLFVLHRVRPLGPGGDSLEKRELMNESYRKPESARLLIRGEGKSIRRLRQGVRQRNGIRFDCLHVSAAAVVWLVGGCIDMTYPLHPRRSLSVSSDLVFLTAMMKGRHPASRELGLAWLKNMRECRFCGTFLSDSVCM